MLTVIVGIFCTNFCSSKFSVPHLSALQFLSATSCWSALLFLASPKPYLLYLPLLSLYHILYYIKNPQVASNRESDTCGKLFWLWTCHARRVMTNLAKTGSPFRLDLRQGERKSIFAFPGLGKGGTLNRPATAILHSVQSTRRTYCRYSRDTRCYCRSIGRKRSTYCTQ